MLKQSHVIGKFMGRLRNTCKTKHNLTIDFSAVGLSRYRIITTKAHLSGNKIVKFFYLFGIIMKKRHKAGLCACCALYAMEPQTLDPHFYFFDIENKILYP